MLPSKTSIWRETIHSCMIDMVGHKRKKKKQFLVELVTTGTHTTGDKESTSVCFSGSQSKRLENIRLNYKTSLPRSHRTLLQQTDRTHLHLQKALLTKCAFFYQSSIANRVGLLI